MTRDDFIQMAREAGLIYWHPNSTFSDGVWWMDAGEPGDEFEHFAALIASRVAAAAKLEMLMAGHDEWLEEARKAEREACAKVCDALAEGWKKYPGKDDSGFIALSNAGVTIRARGETSSRGNDDN